VQSIHLDDKKDRVVWALGKFDVYSATSLLKGITLSGREQYLDEKRSNEHILEIRILGQLFHDQL
jgi:hypothetical protein